MNEMEFYEMAEVSIKSSSMNSVCGIHIFQMSSFPIYILYLNACDVRLLQATSVTLVENSTKSLITFLYFLSYFFPGLHVIEWCIEADV
jgi:hypothetical protein